MTRGLLFAAAAVSMLAGSAWAQSSDWFQHEFGEMRAFHKDWLAACEERGEGTCRFVRAEADPGSSAFFDLRLSVIRLDGTPDWAMEVMDRGMPADALTELVFDFDGEVVTVPQSAWKIGEMDFANVIETITLTDPVVVQDLLDRMMAGNVLEIRYQPVGSGNGKMRLPLRGVTSAVNAVQSIVLPRQE